MGIFPENVSTYGEAIDSLAALITVLVAIGFFVALGLVLYSVLRFRQSSGAKAEYITGERWSQLRWVMIPVLVVLGLDLFIDSKTHSAWAYIKEFRPAPDVQVRIRGQQFSWVFTYPDANGDLNSEGAFQSTGDLHVPVGKNIVFELESKDVLHSFWVPSLRLKQDAVPGRTIMGWFQATKIGEYDIACAQICGGGHTNMQARLIVDSEADFQKWMANKGRAEGGTVSADPVARGQDLVKTKGCIACHSADGSKLVGPTYKGLYMSKLKVTTANQEHEVTADDEYLKSSIVDPSRDVVTGFSPVMPKLDVKDDEVKDIIEYIKTLK